MNNFKVFVGRKWLLIFHHKYETDEDLFNNEEEVLSSSKENKFSILGSIDKSFRRNNKYEFLLEYPEKEGFNQWTQTKNPVFAEPWKENGYKPISISWSNESWHGLARSSRVNHTFIDGSPSHDDWFYSIGTYLAWYGSIPGITNILNYPENEREQLKVREVNLWIRIDNDVCSFRMKRCNQQNFMFTILLFVYS